MEQKRVLRMIYDNKVDDMRKYLREGGNPNFSITYSKSTPICDAESVEMAKLLVEAGADIHRRGTYGMTPLLWQANSFNFEVLLYLLSLDPQLIKDVDDSGETALHKCVTNGYANSLECAKVLLAADPPVDINYINNKGLAALDIAVRSRNVATESIIQLLLEHGANPELDLGYERFPNGKNHAKFVKKFVSNRRNKTMYAQAYRGLAAPLPENTVGIVQEFLEGPTPGPHRFPPRNSKTRKNKNRKSRKSRKSRK
jgi:ankyrin repeat protein